MSAGGKNNPVLDMNTPSKNNNTNVCNKYILIIA